MGHDEHGHSSGAVGISFLLGGLIGAGIALLLAPKSGKETRQRLSELAGEARDKTEDYVEHVRGSVNSAVNKGQDFYNDKKSIIAAAVEAGKEAFEKEKEKLIKGH